MIKISNSRENNYKKIHPYIKDEKQQVKENATTKKRRKTK
jgi:hypothetical protein